MSRRTERCTSLPFGLLRDATSRRLMDNLDLRLVQTGRDLLRPAADHPAKGLVAVGGIDFNTAKTRRTAPSSTPGHPNRRRPTRSMIRSARCRRGLPRGFAA